jgi:hypothetical protein
MISALPNWVFDGSPVATSDPTREVGRICRTPVRAIVAMALERGPVCDNSLRAHLGGLSVAEAVDPRISSPSSSRKKITILWTTMQCQMREFDHHDDLDVEVARVAGVERICVAGRG